MQNDFLTSAICVWLIAVNMVGWLVGVVCWWFGLLMRIKLSWNSNWNHKRSFTCNLQIYTRTNLSYYSFYIPFRWTLNIFVPLFVKEIRRRQKRKKNTEHFPFQFRFISFRLRKENDRILPVDAKHMIFLVMVLQSLITF